MAATFLAAGFLAAFLVPFLAVFLTFLGAAFLAAFLVWTFLTACALAKGKS